MRDRHDRRASIAGVTQNGRGSIRRPSARIAEPGLLLIASIVGAILLVGCFDNEDARPDGDGARGSASQQAGSGSASAKPLANPGPGRITGYVRDVNGNPVARARVRIHGTQRGTRAKSGGRYVLRVPRGARALLVQHPAYATQAVRLTRPAVRGHRIDVSLAATRVERVASNSADALIFWVDCSQVAEMSAGSLDRLVAYGVDGFVCMAGRLRTMGGLAQFTGNVNANLDDAAYDLQRSLRGSAAVQLARKGRLRLYLGFKAADYSNPRTPFKEWFDDAEWTGGVLKPVRELAAAARSLGFAGVALDQELYPGKGGAQSASWNWNYPGNARSEQEVRAQVERRGRQLMTAMLAGYPGLELVAYSTPIAGAWADKIQEVVNDQFGVYADDVRVDLWAGLSSVPGYAAIRWFDSTFYKTPHIGADWAVALEDNANSTYSVLSRRFPNWAYASSRLHVTPFSWIDAGPRDSEYDDAKAPDAVAAQLAAFRDWGTGGMFGNYVYRPPNGFDYAPYAEAMRNASTPGLVDEEPPELSISSPAGGRSIDATGDQIELAGTAHDNYAVRVVRWYDARGRFGTATLTWEAEDSLGEDRTWVTNWRIRGVALSPGVNRITVVAEDIKGLATVRRLRVTR
jgi:Carboxypeptidase regulatory-like domain